MQFRRVIGGHGLPKTDEEDYVMPHIAGQKAAGDNWGLSLLACAVVAAERPQIEYVPIQTLESRRR